MEKKRQRPLPTLDNQDIDAGPIDYPFFITPRQLFQLGGQPISRTVDWSTLLLVVFGNIVFVATPFYLPGVAFVTYILLGSWFGLSTAARVCIFLGCGLVLWATHTPWEFARELPLWTADHNYFCSTVVVDGLDEDDLYYRPGDTQTDATTTIKREGDGPAAAPSADVLAEETGGTGATASQASGESSAGQHATPPPSTSAAPHRRPFPPTISEAYGLPEAAPLLYSLSPHGVYPFAMGLCLTKPLADFLGPPKPRVVAAPAAINYPIFGHIVKWMNPVTADEAAIVDALVRQGSRLVINPGGIAEIFLSLNPEHHMQAQSGSVQHQPVAARRRRGHGDDADAPFSISRVRSRASLASSMPSTVSMASVAASDHDAAATAEASPSLSCTRHNNIIHDGLEAGSADLSLYYQRALEDRERDALEAIRREEEAEAAQASAAGNREVILLRKRKGFVRVALATGTTIVPIFVFGQSQLLRLFNFAGPGSYLEKASRYIRSSLIFFYGRYGLPIPFRVPLLFAIGRPIVVPKPPPAPAPHAGTGKAAGSGGGGKPERPAYPPPDLVDEYHARVVAEVARLYEKYKAVYNPQWATRDLVIL